MDANARRAVDELTRLVDGIAVVMVTTVAADGALRSRPLLLESLEPDGSLVFLTHLSSQKVAELSHDAV